MPSSHIETLNRHHAFAMNAWKLYGNPKFLEWASLHWREITRLYGPLDYLPRAWDIYHYRPLVTFGNYH